MITVKAAKPVPYLDSDQQDVIEAYQKLADACYRQALAACGKSDPYIVARWMEQHRTALRKVNAIGLGRF